MKGSLSIEKYAKKKRSIVDDLSENLHPIFNEDLIGLDSSYGPFVTFFMMRTKDFLVEKLVGLLLQEMERIALETQRQAQPAIFTTTFIDHRHPPILGPQIRTHIT